MAIAPMSTKNTSLLSVLALTAFLVSSAAAQTPPPAGGAPSATPPAGAPAPPGQKKKESSPCKKEVEAAFEKQRKSSGFRMETSLVNTEGPVTMTVVYALPDRMHQVTKASLTGRVTETILIGDKAWFKADKDWAETSVAEAGQIAEQVQNSVVEAPDDVGDFNCNGKIAFEGRDYITYVAEDPASSQKNSGPYRMLYVDPTTGLPVRSVYTLPGKEDKPFFKTVWSYPIDLKVEAPAAK